MGCKPIALPLRWFESNPAHWLARRASRCFCGSRSSPGYPAAVLPCAMRVAESSEESSRHASVDVARAETERAASSLTLAGSCEGVQVNPGRYVGLTRVAESSEEYW